MENTVFFFSRRLKKIERTVLHNHLLQNGFSFVKIAISVFLIFQFSPSKIQAQHNYSLYQSTSSGMELNGSLTTQLNFYNTDRAFSRYNSPSYNISGNPSIKNGDLDISVNFNLGNRDQPNNLFYNKIGLRTSYKWITSTLGHQM